MGLQSVKGPGIGDRENCVTWASLRCWLLLKISTWGSLGHPLEQGKEESRSRSTMGDRERGEGYPDMTVDIILARCCELKAANCQHSSASGTAGGHIRDQHRRQFPLIECEQKQDNKRQCTYGVRTAEIASAARNVNCLWHGDSPMLLGNAIIHPVRIVGVRWVGLGCK